LNSVTLPLEFFATTPCEFVVTLPPGGALTELVRAASPPALLPPVDPLPALPPVVEVVCEPAAPDVPDFVAAGADLAGAAAFADGAALAGAEAVFFAWAAAWRADRMACDVSKTRTAVAASIFLTERLQSPMLNMCFPILLRYRDSDSRAFGVTVRYSGCMSLILSSVKVILMSL
jgi:hypothetical protein